MPSEWREVAFGSVLDGGTRNGLTRPTRVRGAGARMVNMGEMFAHRRIGDIPMERVPLSDAEKPFLLEKGDLLFARQSLVLAGAGKCSVFQGASEPVTFEGHLIRARTNRGIADPWFYFYYFGSPLGRGRVESIIEQVAAAGVRARDLTRLMVPCPPLPVQRAIAHILGTLDDRIELNREMNETLEQMARALFKSWFVDFEPFRDKGMVDSLLGKIPKGWRVKPLPKVIEVNSPRALKKGVLASYLDMQNVPERGHRPKAWVKREYGSGMRFQNGDTLVARITPCLENGKTAFVDFLEEGQVGWGSTEFIVLCPKPPLPAYYGYLLARTEEFRSHAIQNMTGSSGRQRVPPQCLSQFGIVVPDEPVAKAFGGLVQPIAERIRSNSEQCATLAAIRDALLPKLMSGEVAPACGKQDAICS